MHGLRGRSQMMFTPYIVVVDDECLRTATEAFTTPARFSSVSARTPVRNAPVR
jgi:hypothetical protein